MEREITREHGMYDRVMPLPAFNCWIDGFHAGVQTQHEIVQIETQAQTIGHCYLLVKTVETKLSARLICIVLCVPNVSCVDKSGAMKFPKQMRSVFHAQIELEISGLVDEINFPIVSFVAAWAKFSDTPTTHTVCTSREITLFIRQDT